MRKFAYFGTPAVASVTLAALLARGYIPTVVVTAPDAPKGRGLVLTPSPTRVLAEAHRIPVVTPGRLDSTACETVRAYECEYAVVVAYGKILPKDLIDAFALGVLNIHYSLLPKYRGASPVESVLLADEQVTGVSIQRMVEELDAGDVFLQKEITISPTETAKQLRPRLIAAGAGLLLALLPKFEAGQAEATPQDATQATRCRKIRKEDGELDFKQPQLNWHKYRAYADWPGTFFFAERGGRRIRVKVVEAHEEQGAFIIDRVIPEGRREIAYKDFVREL